MSSVVDINEQDPKDERTALHRACFRCDLQEVRRLLDSGARVNVEDRNKTSPLHLAANNDSIELVALLLDHGADIDAPDCTAWTVLHQCCYYENFKMMEFLLFRGADCTKRALHNDTSLYVASFWGRLAHLKLLVACDISVLEMMDSEDQATPLICAVVHNHVGCVRLLLELNANCSDIDPESTNNTTIKSLLIEHSEKPEHERVQTAKDTLKRLQSELGARWMRLVQPEIIGICLAFAPLDLPPYVLLWITDELPNYDKLSHHKKIELITSVRNSIWKLKNKSEL